MRQDSTARASSRDRQAGVAAPSAIASHTESKDNSHAHSKDERHRETAKQRKLNASQLDAVMTPGVRYTCVALAKQLNGSPRQIKASLSQLVDAGTVRHVQEARIGIYWVPTHAEKRNFEEKRMARRTLLRHTLEGYDADLRRLQSLCMLVRRS
ncbi:hypothetical protein JNB89_18310 [Paraburkholderia phenoliruptrix]|nr:hypothetical protein [Paraburkholderia phenoliruptrix]MBW9130417.1 hypothetical protein [Paraburkholderia ginsengiterrae]